jgi:hypothetical protein
MRFLGVWSSIVVALASVLLENRSWSKICTHSSFKIIRSKSKYYGWTATSQQLMIRIPCHAILFLCHLIVGRHYLIIRICLMTRWRCCILGCIVLRLSIHRRYGHMGDICRNIWHIHWTKVGSAYWQSALAHKTTLHQVVSYGWGEFRMGIQRFCVILSYPCRLACIFLGELYALCNCWDNLLGRLASWLVFWYYLFDRSVVSIGPFQVNSASNKLKLVLCRDFGGRRYKSRCFYLPDLEWPKIYPR